MKKVLEMERRMPPSEDEVRACACMCMHMYLTPVHYLMPVHLRFQPVSV